MKIKDFLEQTFYYTSSTKGVIIFGNDNLLKKKDEGHSFFIFQKRNFLRHI